MNRLTIQNGVLSAFAPVMKANGDFRHPDSCEWGGNTGFLCLEPHAGMVSGLDMPKALLPGRQEQYSISIRKADCP